ncbi:MAG: YitT family protein [Faecalicatena sp.]|uniref:YitT family protein n=1 Tax=Faecalicatena sp. TaxID=2005360 RepID=UPI002590520D|nr:YitT family protein [Faecalicatena sp.]MCI6464447.1 YitT family protein [Faecalicatena sp.]MDY5618325.1 YitT family protein [Lachnospiraceae bacterium]
MSVSNFKNIFFVFLGNTIYALGITMFILPSGIITGGTTGLALTFNHYFQVPISLFVFGFNLLMFILGAAVLGKRFALTTLISTFYYPIILGIFQKIPALSQITNDRMLCTICGGIMIGFSIGLVIHAGASTGGMDIPPLVLNKKLGLSVSAMLYVFDCTILILQMTFSNAEQTIYGIVLVMIYSVILDKFLMMGTSQTQVKIISAQYELINQAIQKQLDRGTTFLQAETGYLNVNQPIILSVISNRELVKLNKLVMDIDPKAFIIISHVNEVKGRGFSSQKIYK